MTVATLIQQLKTMAQPDDEVILIVEDSTDRAISMAGVFTGKVIGSGTGAETGKCEIYGLE